MLWELTGCLARLWTVVQSCQICKPMAFNQLESASGRPGRRKFWCGAWRSETSKDSRVRRTLQVKVEQRKVHGETDPNIVLNWIRRPLDGGKTDEQRTHDKGQFEMKCQRRQANHAVKLDRVMQVLKMNCLRQEREVQYGQRKREQQRSFVMGNMEGLISQWIVSFADIICCKSCFFVWTPKLTLPLNNTCINITMAIILIIPHQLVWAFIWSNKSLTRSRSWTNQVVQIPPSSQHVLGHAGDVWILINQTPTITGPPLVVHRFEVLTVTPSGWAVAA